MYLYGHPFSIETDHKPLEMITQKCITSESPHLQEMFLFLQQYDITIRYRPWKEMQLPDALSKHSGLKKRHEIPLDLYVDYISFSDSKLA